MLNVFKFDENRLSKVDVADEGEQLTAAGWIDLLDPEPAERIRVQQLFNQALVSEPELDDIEASARFFEDEDGLHIHSFFLYTEADNHVVNTTVAFTLRDGRLFTLREQDLATFRLYLLRVNTRKTHFTTAREILLGLFDTKVEQLADEIETIYNHLDDLSRLIMRGSAVEGYDEGLARLAELENITSKIRLCLMDSQRALNFLIRKGALSNYELDQARELVRDIESLLPHNEAVFQKINFLLQAAMGFINMEQNKIIKIFSVVSVVFLPPTLVASSYGMNFHIMPELGWTYGYPIAIGVMITAALAPYVYFKRRKWL